MRSHARRMIALTGVLGAVLAVSPVHADSAAAAATQSVTPSARSGSAVVEPPVVTSARDCRPTSLPGPVRPDPRGRLILDSLTGPVTNSEVTSFRTFMDRRGLPTSSLRNALAYGAPGTDTEALGDVYSFTDDVRILDRMLQFTDRMLSLRNDPARGRVMWTGNREPVWPTKEGSAQDAGYAGSEQGDTVAHIAYAAELILATPCLWARRIGVGDPHGYGATYRERAERYVRELDRTAEGYLLRHFVRPGTNRFHWPVDARWARLGSRYEGDQGKSIPWNQQTMLAGAFQRLARCHELLGDSPQRVATYDRVVRAFTTWFLSDVRTSTVSGHRVYNWGYNAGRRQPEDTGHGGYDVLGMVRAGQRGAYGLTSAQLEPFANTAAYVMYKGSDGFAKRVDGTGGTTDHLSAGWVRSARYSDRLYTVAGEAAVASGRVRTTPSLHATILLLKDERNSGT